MTPDDQGDAAKRRLLVDTVDLQRRAGARRELVQTVSFPELGAGEFSVVDGRLEVDLVIEAVAEGIVAKGTAAGHWTGPCRRCLEPIVAPLDVKLHEIFERHPTDGETWPIEDERIDLAPVLHEAALLSFPLVPLCRDDCEGPEPDRFPTTVEADVDLTGDGPAPDARWAALDDLKFDDPNADE